MGELWRSKEMTLVELAIQLDAAKDTVDELGEQGLIQFKDVSSVTAVTFLTFSLP